MPKKRVKDIIAVLVRMLKEHHSPHEIALGVAVGSFIGILPLYGFHTALCVVAAILIPRANKLAILIGTNISLPPTIAIITWTAYDIGRLIFVNKNYPPFSWEYIRNFKVSSVSEFYYPLFMGSLVLGLLCAAAFYFITLAITNHFKNKRLHDK
ncbi:MAG: DUF2062 domain-containing protein [Candidatus Omnitrophota bacterium]